ncbi:FG-GAP-like repeat-containing protein [Streptomyces odontomachi]|uniref:FG-GAP-like repeat-containing protein n=1 Tax=Streptomyces odontomachi TaxID=2944940 RepID=UPI00210DFB04|nr:FG-GAP-like repeat-containing protein [Streptomyces sp. ODS25]
MLSKYLTVRRAAPLLVAGVIALGAGPLSTVGHAAGSGDGRTDFNGDGYADLVVGAPAGTIGGQGHAGYVVVMYGGPDGPSATRYSVISRATGGIPGDPVKDERFGAQVSKGDLDGDGYADLVVSGTGKGSVIVWGGSAGLSGGTAVPGYGSASQTGDFNGDGQRDLALFQTSVAPGDDPMGTTAAIWYGPVSRTGTPASSTTLDNQDLGYFDVWDAVPGDVDHDGRTDLALSVYCGEGTYCTRLYLGAPSGLTSTPSGTAPEGWQAMALGDVNGDGYADMVTGNAMDNQITVAYGSASGLTDPTTWQTFTQDTPGVPGADEPEDGFGTSVSVGDVTGDGYADVVVGSPGEALGTTQGAGDVTLLHGGPSGLTGDGAQVITQNTTGVPGTAEAGDGFGSRVRLLDTDADGHADLAAAATGENSGTGAVWALHGQPTGIVPDGALVVGPVTLGTPDTAASFGSTLR